MAGFSIDAALKSGFRLARREPLSVFVWGVGYSVAGLLIQAVAIGPALPAYLRTVVDDPEAAAALVERSTEAHAILTLPIMVVASLAAAAVFYGAIGRAMLRPEERGFFYLKVSKRELWLILTLLVLTLGMIAVTMAGTFVVTVLTTLVGGWGALLAFPAVVGFIYLAARFSTTWVQSFDEARLVVLDGWRRTKGQGWRIVLMLLALLLLILIIAAVVIIPAGIVGGILLGVASMSGGGGGMAVTAVVGLAALILLPGMYGLFLAVLAAPCVEVYRSLRGVGLPGGETAEVFA